MITKSKEKRKGSIVERSQLIGHYMAKYFNLFLNRFKFEGDVSDEAVAFLMRQFWTNGTVACFKLEGSEGSTEHPAGLPVFVPYAAQEFNLYNYPTKVTLIQLRGARFVPTAPQTVDEQVVIGWIQRNKEGVVRVVDHYAKRIASVEMVLQVNMNAQKYPWIVGTSPEGSQKSRALADMLLEDNPTLFVELEEIDKAKALVSGAPYIIDKLYNYKISLENELREYLGLENLGIGEKKEHLLNDEIAANNEVTGASGDVYIDCLNEFFARVKKVLGIDIRVSLNVPEAPAVKEPEEEEPQND